MVSDNRGSSPERPKDRLDEPLWRLHWRARDLQALLRHPDRSSVGRQEFPAASAFHNMPVQLWALGQGQRPLEVVGDQIFQLRTRDHLAPGPIRLPVVLIYAKAMRKVPRTQTYRHR